MGSGGRAFAPLLFLCPGASGQVGPKIDGLFELLYT